jgi:hypothetical protein
MRAGGFHEQTVANRGGQDGTLPDEQGRQPGEAAINADHPRSRPHLPPRAAWHARRQDDGRRVMVPVSRPGA